MARVQGCSSALTRPLTMLAFGSLNQQALTRGDTNLAFGYAGLEQA
ncbi:MAG: hypothetical protein ACI87E_005104, partial [Mariniblastus sp.]